MPLTELLVPSFAQMLRALSAWLDKAEQHAVATGEAPDAPLSWRLIADMYPLGAQVRFCCVQAHEAVHRLRGEAMPASLDAIRDEGRDAGQHPGSMGAARARIAEALALLGSVAPGALDDGDRPVSIDLPPGIAFDLTGAQYARDWALPQFYFHVAMAYAILRNRGVPLGKADYVPHMFAYLRAAPPAR